MSLEYMISQFQEKAENTSPIGGILKFEVDGQGIIIDGSGEKNRIFCLYG